MAGRSVVYAVAAVERIIGESAGTISSWEERYGLPSPLRTPGGRPLYTRDDVVRLRWLAKELAAGREPEPLGGEVAAEVPPSVEEPRSQILVLVAERESRAADLEEYFLRTEGYQVEVTASALEAEAGAAAMHPDVAVVELNVSGHAGLDLCRRLHEVSDAAVVAVSTLDRRDEALDAGAEAFLLKPLDPLVLVSTIKDLLGASAYLRSGGDAERGGTG